MTPAEYQRLAEAEDYAVVFALSRARPNSFSWSAYLRMLDFELEYYLERKHQ